MSATLAPHSIVEDETVVVSGQAVGSPFAGMTVGQVRLMNSALHGLPVEVYGGRVKMGPEVYIFSRMVLPGDWCHFIEAPGDLRLIKTDEEHLPRFGLSRVLSASLIRRFDVLAHTRAYRSCETCGRVLPLTAKVYDLARLSNHVYDDGEFEWHHRWECQTCWAGTS